jgi:hypothetical protein
MSVHCFGLTMCGGWVGGAVVRPVLVPKNPDKMSERFMVSNETTETFAWWCNDVRYASKWRCVMRKEERVLAQKTADVSTNEEHVLRPPCLGSLRTCLDNMPCSQPRLGCTLQPHRLAPSQNQPAMIKGCVCVCVCVCGRGGDDGWNLKS